MTDSHTGIDTRLKRDYIYRSLRTVEHEHFVPVDQAEYTLMFGTEASVSITSHRRE